MIRFAAREPAESCALDPPGVLRVSIPWIGFDRLTESAFEQIRLYAKGDAAVSLRLLRALTDVALTTQDLNYRRTLVEMGKRVVAGCAEKLNERELEDLRVREAALEKFGLPLPKEAQEALGVAADSRDPSPSKARNDN